MNSVHLTWGKGLAVLAALLLAGCKGAQHPAERQARRELAAVTQSYRPQGKHPALPVLTTNSSLSDYLKFAMFNQPQIEAAYYDWAGSVEKITVDRSLPDPKFTFQAYITDTLTSLMPGLMQDLPGRGKLKAAANVAAAESDSKYHAFETSVLQSAFAVKQSYYQLGLLEEKIRIDRQMLALLGELERSARARNAVGQVTLQDVYRAQIERDKVATEMANLEDSRSALQAQFKGALGLSRTDPDPALPARFESTPNPPDEHQLLDATFNRSHRLTMMESEVRLAEALIGLAGKAKNPDFTVGLQAEVYEPPFYWPQASMTVPIWRDKIAAQIAQAQAGKKAAEARLNAEEISLSIDFAARAYDYREVTRNLALLHDQLIPKGEKALQIARGGYLSGQADFLNLIDAEKALLDFQLQEAEGRARLEIILADLSLSIAGVAPAGAPILKH